MAKNALDIRTGVYRVFANTRNPYWPWLARKNVEGIVNRMRKKRLSDTMNTTDDTNGTGGLFNTPGHVAYPIDSIEKS